MAPVHVVPNGLDFEAIEKERGESVPTGVSELLSGAPFVLFLGRVSWKKGIDRLIDAMELVPGVRLIVAGNDEEGLRPELERRARAAGLSDRTFFLGETRGGGKWALLEHAAAVCLPSRSENFGLTVLEALAVGTPAIVTKEVGVAGFSNLASFLTIASPERQALAAALNLAVSGTGTSPDRSRRARECVRRDYNWDRLAARLATVYR